ncbi:ubiquitin-conjugating enzyme/RWD-like protein [Phascolomyces articulosus]|uniref:Ubiquitin-conjugating enzyme/RWD-like protein n=1 Tax=Phascolomyces articulosus TaxID=60185 RepID=A0AAD5PJ11_9FUNG|nr:ubiquitin-conjugating enzyme/RWD-like protein [Phascolomyces articulosus]
MANKYNLKNPAVKRIMQEARELAMESCYEYEAHPLEDNLFEWHFTVRGPGDTEFEEGRYHGRILLPAEYPFKPPELIFLTPNGRFELNTKVCLSITGYHPEYWQPAWGIRTVILAVMGFFPTEARGAIGGLDYTKEERRKFAKKSNTWKCSVCEQRNDELLSDSAPRKTPVSSEQDMPKFSLSYKKDNNSKKDDLSSDTTKHANDQQKNTNGITEPHPTPEQQQPSSSSLPSSSTCAQHATKENNPTPASASGKTKSLVTPVKPTNNIKKRNGRSSDTRSRSRNSSSTTIVQRNLNRPPFWLDALIGGLVILVLTLLIRRYT